MSGRWPPQNLQTKPSQIGLIGHQTSQAIIVVLLAAEIGLSTTSFTSGVHAYWKAPNSLPCLCLKGSPCRVRGLTMDYCPDLLMVTTEPDTINVWCGAVAWRWLKRTSWLRVASLQATEALNPAAPVILVTRTVISTQRAHPPRSALGTRGVPCRIVVSASVLRWLWKKLRVRFDGVGVTGAGAGGSLVRNCCCCRSR